MERFNRIQEKCFKTLIPKKKFLTLLNHLSPKLYKGDKDINMHASRESTEKKEFRIHSTGKIILDEQLVEKWV